MWELGIYSAIAPLILLLVSAVWQYPAILEEVVKWGIFKLGSSGKVIGGRDGAIVGLIFGLSEAVLFSMNAWSGGEWGAMAQRLLLTVPMHVVTAMIIGWGMKNRVGWLGMGIAMGVHAIFNYLIG